MNIKINFRDLKYIFIDFDGTLVDTVPILFDNYSKFLKKYDRKGSLEEFQSLMGPAIEEFIPILIERHQLKQNPQELIQIYTQGLADRYTQEAKLLPGALGFLNYIKDLGLKMALVTSTAHFLIEGCLEKLQLKNYFNPIITGEKVKKTKPNPDIYLLALKNCLVRPEEVLTIEDSYNGLLASIRAKIPTMAIQNIHLLEIPEQAMLVKNWDHLLKLFRNNYARYHQASS